MLRLRLRVARRTLELPRYAEERRCYNCNGFGHFARDCPTRARCYICGKPHLARHCPDRNPAIEASRRLHVRGLTEMTRWQDLKDHFREYGVAYTRVDAEGGIVQFHADEDAERAMALDGSLLDGARLSLTRK